MAMNLPMAATSLMFLVLLVLLSSVLFTEAQLGICYGTQSDVLPSPEDVVNLYQCNGIEIMRIYDEPYQPILEAITGTDIQVVLGFNNDNLQSLGSDDGSMAMQWVETNVSPYASNIKNIVVGNEVALTPKLAQYVAPAMKNFINALNSAGLDDCIQVTTSISMNTITDDSFPPSAGRFKDEAIPFMQQVVSILESSETPLLLNIFPYFSYSSDPRINVDYALGNPNAPPVHDNNTGYMYHSLYDAQLDTVYAALDKLVISPNSDQRRSNVMVKGSETGHPTAGGGKAASMINALEPMGGRNVANPINAQMYNQNIINKVKSRKGTPSRPDIPLEIYLFALFDEDKKPGNATEHYFGLYTPDLQPKYQLNF